MATNLQRSTATKRKLLDATLESLVERGYARSSTTDICERAGVSRGAQLHHFPTKAELFSAAVEHLLEKRHLEFRKLVGVQPGDLGIVMEKLWDIYSGPTLSAWQEIVVAARTEPHLRDQLADVNERFTAEAETTFRQIFGAGDVPEVAIGARLIMGLLDGLALNHVLEDSDALALTVLRMFQGLIGQWFGGNQPPN